MLPARKRCRPKILKLLSLEIKDGDTVDVDEISEKNLWQQATADMIRWTVFPAVLVQ